MKGTGWWMVPLAVAAGLMPLALMVGFRSTANKNVSSEAERRKTDEGIKIIVAVDVTASNETRRTQYLGLLDLVVEEAMPENSALSLWCFGRKSRKLYEGRPRSAQELWALADRELRTSDPEPGTYVGHLLVNLVNVELSRLAERQTGAIVLLWDGGCDDEEVLQAALSELAKEDRLCAVWAAGVKSELRTLVEEKLAPMTERLLVSGFADAGWALRRFRKLLTKTGGE